MTEHYEEIYPGFKVKVLTLKPRPDYTDEERAAWEKASSLSEKFAVILQHWNDTGGL